MSFLKAIVKTKKDEVVILKKKRKELENYQPKGKAGFFKNALSQDKINLIAEVKKASPSVGVIRQDFSPH
jgi:indole-3-glycerol phosphate synthase